EKSGMGWLWFPMESAQPIAEERYEELARLFRQMENILNQNGRIYIHCSAGIHRTGMITYAFLIYLGLGKEAAQLKLKELRGTTMENVGEERLAWGDNIVFKISGEA